MNEVTVEARLRDAIHGMDIPEMRRDTTNIGNVAWLRRNMRINNRDHREFEHAWMLVNWLLGDKTFHEFKIMVLKSHRPRVMRPGEWSFVWLSMVRLDLTVLVSDTNSRNDMDSVDPYWDNSNLHGFWAFIEDNW